MCVFDLPKLWKIHIVPRSNAIYYRTLILKLIGGIKIHQCSAFSNKSMKHEVTVLKQAKVILIIFDFICKFDSFN